MPSTGFFSNRAGSVVSVKNCRMISGYDFLDAFMPLTKDIDFVVECHVSNDVYVSSIPSIFKYTDESTEIEQLSAVRYRPYGHDFAVIDNIAEDDCADNGLKNDFFHGCKHLVSKAYASKKDPPEIVETSGCIDSWLADCNVKTSDMLSDEFFYIDSIRTHGNAAVIPIYDYRVKFMAVLYDPPLSNMMGYKSYSRNQSRGSIDMD